MKFTDKSEAGLETAIVKSLIEEAGYQAGNPQDYHRAYAVDCSMRPGKLMQIEQHQKFSNSNSKFLITAR